MKKSTKPVQRGNSTKIINPVNDKSGLPPIKSDVGGSTSRSASRGATPPVSVESTGLNLPAIRPPSAKVFDTTTRVQIKDREKDASSHSDRETPHQAAEEEAHKIDQELQAAQNVTQTESEEQETSALNESDHSSEDAFLLLSSSSRIEIEDPERQYWMVHTAPHKNAPNIAKEALKRMQAASASKKLDFSDMGLVSIPDKVQNGWNSRNPISGF